MGASHVEPSISLTLTQFLSLYPDGTHLSPLLFFSTIFNEALVVRPI